MLQRGRGGHYGRGGVLMEGHAVQIKRESFARGDVVRRTVGSSGTCAWCGQRRKGGKLFRYGWDSDGGRVSWQDRLFCSVGCRDAYYS